MPLGIDATIRYALNNWTRPLRESELADATRPTTRACAGPAADADRQPRPRLDPGRRAPGERRRTSTTSSSPAATARTLLLDRRAVPARRRRLQPQRARSAAARTRRSAEPSLTSADAPPRRPRLARRPQPLAGDAQRGAARARARATGATSCLPVPPELFAETVRALPAAGFVGANVTIPHKEAALALADSGDATSAPRSAPPTR